MLRLLPIRHQLIVMTKSTQCGRDDLSKAAYEGVQNKLVYQAAVTNVQESFKRPSPPENTRRSSNVGSLLGQRLRWPNFEPILFERLVFAGLLYYRYHY